MKNKTKSLKTRIFALVAVVLILCASCLPCFAVIGNTGVAYNWYGGVPIYLKLDHTGHFVNRYSPEAYQKDYRWGTPINYDQYNVDIYEDGDDYEDVLRNNVVAYYDDDTRYIYFGLSTSNFELTTSDDYFCEGFDADYDIMCGNFLIDTAEDSFNFIFQSDEEYEYSISGVYTIIDSNGNAGVPQYFAINGDATNWGGDDYDDAYGVDFALSRYISSLLGYSPLIYVSAFTISCSTNRLVPDSIFNQIFWYQSETLIERNFDVADIRSDGTVINSELNFFDTVSQFFENLGIDKYKDSFDNFTADYTSWLGNAVGGFLNMELFPFFSIGGILLICVAIGLVGYFLKVFMGG